MQFSQESNFLMFNSVELGDLDEVASHILSAQMHPVNLLDAPMGSGKTTLANAIIRQWGSDDAGSSPTFALIEEHHGSAGKLYHVDAYRIEDEEEAYNLGFEEYVDEGCPVWIEWGENVQSFLPFKVGRVVITASTETTRDIAFYPEVDSREIEWNHE